MSARNVGAVGGSVGFPCGLRVSACLMRDVSMMNFRRRAVSTQRKNAGRCQFVIVGVEIQVVDSN